MSKVIKKKRFRIEAKKLALNYRHLVTCEISHCLRCDYTLGYMTDLTTDEYDYILDLEKII